MKKQKGLSDFWGFPPILYEKFESKNKFDKKLPAALADNILP